MTTLEDMADYVDLWIPWAASSSHDGILYGHSFYAPDYESALEICAKMQWQLDGRIEETPVVSDAELAYVEKQIIKPEIH